MIHNSNKESTETESDLDSRLSTLTGARQTMSSWAKLIESQDEIPEVFRSSHKMLLGDRQVFPHTVFAPAIAGLGYKTTAKLICEMDDTIHVFERIGNHILTKEYPLKTISDLEVGCILLFSWITISGLTKAGEAASSTIEFNTATSRHFAHFVNKLRPAPHDTNAIEQSAERAKLDYLATEAYKFMNFARESLVDGEKIIQTLWQPKISKPIIRFGGYAFHRTLALAHLTILTDKELIVIQDDERSGENRGIRYGGKWHYIGLSHIKAVSLLDRADDMLVLSIMLSQGERTVEIIFAPSKKQEVVQMQTELERLMR